MVKGEKKILYIKVGANWLPIGCLVNTPINENTDFLPTTTRESNGWETQRPTNQNYTIDVEAYTTTDVTKISYNGLKALKRSRSLVEWKLEDDIDREVGFAYISQIGETSEVGQFLQFSLTLTGQGNITQSLVSEPEPEAVIGLPILALKEQTDSIVTIWWTVPPSTNPIASFNVYRDDLLYYTVAYPSIIPVVTYKDFGVFAGTSYAYNVQAVDSLGNEGPLSNRVITEGSIVDKPGGALDYITYERWESGDVGPYGMLFEDGEPVAYETTI